MIFEHPLARRRAAIPKPYRGRAGLSLIEVLFSLLILLVIALSVPSRATGVEPWPPRSRAS